MQNRNKQIEIEEEPEKTGRRSFLSKVWNILGLVALAELAFFTVSLLKPGKKDLKNNPASLIKVAGSVEDFQKNSVTPDRINKYFLVRSEDGGFLALSLICSHLGCSVIWDKTKTSLYVPAIHRLLINSGMLSIPRLHDRLIIFL